LGLIAVPMAPKAPSAKSNSDGFFRPSALLAPKLGCSLDEYTEYVSAYRYYTRSLEASRNEFWATRSAVRARQARPTPKWTTDFVDVGLQSQPGADIYDVYPLLAAGRNVTQQKIVSGQHRALPQSPLTLTAARALLNPRGALDDSQVFIALNPRRPPAPTGAVPTAAARPRDLLVFGEIVPSPLPEPPTAPVVSDDELAQKKARATARRRRQRHSRALRRKAKLVEEVKLSTSLKLAEASAAQADFTLVSRRKKATKALATVVAAKAKDTKPTKAPGSYRKVRDLTGQIDLLASAIAEDRSEELPDLLDSVQKARNRLKPKSVPPVAP